MMKYFMLTHCVSCKKTVLQNYGNPMAMLNKRCLKCNDSALITYKNALTIQEKL